MFNELDYLCVQTLRGLAVDMIEEANSGHPGLPLGAAPMAYVLWQRHLRHHPQDPQWPNRDRFVLSAGHGSALLYALLHLTGYALTLEDLQNFRRLGSKTPGHPEVGVTPGVEVTTGPLGQGAASAVGLALAERALAQYFNREVEGETQQLVDHFTYALVSDGDLMEGVAAEAASLAGHLQLGKLIYLYDANQVTLDGPTELTYTEDVARRFTAYGWQVLEVKEGDTDLEAIDQALSAAKQETRKPSLLIINTTIGYGAPHKQGTSAAHGAPLGKAETLLLKERLGLPKESSFYIPQAVQEHLAATSRGESLQQAWQGLLRAYKRQYPALGAAWELALSGQLPADWLETSGLAHLNLEEFSAPLATREASGIVLNKLAKSIPWLIGGDADLSCSTFTKIQQAPDFTGATGAAYGRNIRFGVREHAMAAIANGIAYHGGLRIFIGGFFIFSDYMRPAMRLAAMNKLKVIYVFTHDSLGVGEDGPTHQPIEQLVTLRAVPGMTVLRPADALETQAAWRYALEEAEGPVALILSRQKLPLLAREGGGAITTFMRGGYVLADWEEPQKHTPALLIATGAEVALALAARALLRPLGIDARVVSLLSLELFKQQSSLYQEQVLPKAVKVRVAVEAALPLSFRELVGDSGVLVGLRGFGASGAAPELFKFFGLTPEKIVEAVVESVAKVSATSLAS